MANQAILMKIGNLSYRYPKKGFGGEEKNCVINNLSLNIRDNHRHGLIGESTCGKTTLGKLMALIFSEIDGGHIKFGNNDKSIFQYSSLENREYHKRVQMIYQSPEASLNPGMKIYEIITEGIKAGWNQKKKLTKEYIQQEVNQYLSKINLLDKKESYPDALSGGEKRRISIIRVLAMKPKIIIADEPFSSLDASLRNQILDLFLEDAKQREVSYIFILHDLDVAKFACETISVMYMGRIVEEGLSNDILSENAIRHPYTDTLFYAQYPDKAKILNLPKHKCQSDNGQGCIYRERCYLYWDNSLTQEQKKLCEQKSPNLGEQEKEHRIACHFRIIW